MLRLTIVLASLGTTLAACGGCFSRSHVTVDLSIPRDCLMLEVITEARSCGGPENEVTLTGTNTCGVALKWPPAEEGGAPTTVASGPDPFEVKLPLKKGKITTTFTLGVEQISATYTIPG